MTQTHRKQQNGKSYSPEVRQRAIRFVIEHRVDLPVKLAQEVHVKVTHHVRTV